MDMYVEKYANKFMAHKCNELFTGVMELVAVREQGVFDVLYYAHM